MLAGKRNVTLAELTLDHDVGVTRTKVYEPKEVSDDFFDVAVATQEVGHVADEQR